MVKKVGIFSEYCSFEMHDWNYDVIVFVGNVIPSDEEIKKAFESKCSVHEGSDSREVSSIGVFDSIESVKIEDGWKVCDVAKGIGGRVDDGKIEWAKDDWKVQ
jgi:hypothetical protein